MTEPDQLCPECGFVYDVDKFGEAAGLIDRLAGELARILGSAPEAVRRRNEAQWSPLEYVCHVRDVLLVQRERTLAVRRGTGTTPEPMGRDERAEHDGYAAQNLVDVVVQVTEAARLFANVLRRLGPHDWELTMMYSYPSPHVRSLRWLAIHTVHELQHHLVDIRRQLGDTATRGSPRTGR